MEKYEVIIDLPAEQDLDGMMYYVTNKLQEPMTAVRLFMSIYEQILKLDVMPYRHEVIYVHPQTGEEIRRVPVENYSIFYFVDREVQKVHVIRILYNRREWQNLI